MSYNQNKMPEPLVNTIEERLGQEFEYSVAPPGVHVCGLVKVKNKVRFNKFNNQNEPAIQFTFRLKDDPKAYVNLTVAAKLNERSNLFKLLQKMSGYQYTLTAKDNSEAAYYLIMRLDNSWFDVAVIHKQSNKPGAATVYACIPDNQVTPAKACPQVTPKEWFEANQGKGGLRPAIPSAPQDEPEWLSAPEKGGEQQAATYNPDDDDDIPF